MTTEELYMSRCIQLAKNGLYGAAPNPMVGAVIVHNGKIIGEGYHIQCGGPHAEVNAINSVKDESLLAESTIYVSLEPCAHYGKTPPCADLIIKKGIPRVVIGCKDPFAKVDGRGIDKLIAAGIDVKVGVLEKECLELNKRFITFHTKKRPYITLKWAESADGFIDRPRTCENNKAFVFSSEVSSMLTHKQRALNKAIMVGTNTAVYDNPSLTTREWPGTSPLRIVTDRKGNLQTNLNLFYGKTPTLAFIGLNCKLPEYSNNTNVECSRIDYDNNPLRQITDHLYNKGIQTLLVEGGNKLLSSFIEKGLWDEIYIEHTKHLLYNGVSAPTKPNGLTNIEEFDDSLYIHIEKSDKKEE